MMSPSVALAASPFCRVGEAAQTAGDVAGGQRVAFKHRHDADHIEQRAVFSGGLRLDAHQVELLRAQAERFGRQRLILA